MGDKTSGADAQVFSDNTPEEWYGEEDMAGPSDGQDKPDAENSDDDDSEDDNSDDAEDENEEDEDDSEDDSDEDDSDEDAEGDEGDKEEDDDEDDRSTFRKTLADVKGEPLPDKRQRYPEMTEADYTVREDGGVDIHAKHIVDDYEAIQEDLSTYFKIFDSKKGQPKAELIAEKLLGFEGDGLRTAGRVAYDVLDAYHNADKAGKEKIMEDHFPDILKNKEDEPNATFVPREESKDESGDDGEAHEDAVNEETITRALKLWKGESGAKISIDKAMDDPDFHEAFENLQYDTATGELLDVESRIALAADVTFGDKPTNPEKEKEISVGGKKKGQPKKGKKSKESGERVFSDTTMGNPKEWY